MDVPSLAQMLINLQQSLPWLTRLVNGTAYVMGFFFAASAMYNLKQYGEARLMSPGNADLRGPIISITIGAALVYLPSFLSASVGTFFGYTNPLRYETVGTNWDLLAETIVDIIQFVGLIAIVKALVLLRRANTSGGGGQQGLVGRGITHFIGGVLAMNIVGTSNVLLSTLGF